MKIAIIGAGLGGISSACLLASQGHDITVLEKNDRPGGKIGQVKSSGFRFDTGPSLLTMPHVLESLFERCDANIANYLQLKPLEPICRYFYQDGTRFNCYRNQEQMMQEINRIAPEDTGSYMHFLDYAEQLYKRTKDAFLFNPLYNSSDLSSINLSAVFKIDALKTVADRVDSIFDSPYLRQMFKRFPTYNGSSPYRVPATLNVIPHVELKMGGFYIDGGMYKLIEALMRLARKQGVTFNFNEEVQHIGVQNNCAEGVQTATKWYNADVVLSNSDATETYLKLLPESELSYIKKKRLHHIEPSCSGFVLLLGTDTRFEQLAHHNVFFSDDYRREFDSIFNRKTMPDDPTIYIANTSASNPEHTLSGGSNLFILVNAPYLSDKWDWNEKGEEYSNFIIDELEQRGLNGLSRTIVFHDRITPIDFYEQYRSNKGSIYGTSSNSKMAAFMRPRNKARGVEGLYLTGGSTHPGGGIPLVIQSAFNAVELIARYSNE